jgi:hypothetical protein
MPNQPVLTTLHRYGTAFPGSSVLVNQKWDISKSLTEKKGFTNIFDCSVIIALLLHHGEDLPVPQNER